MCVYETIIFLSSIFRPIIVSIVVTNPHTCHHYNSLQLCVSDLVQQRIEIEQEDAALAAAALQGEHALRRASARRSQLARCAKPLYFIIEFRDNLVPINNDDTIYIYIY